MVAINWVRTAWVYARDCSRAASAPLRVLRSLPKASISHCTEGETEKEDPPVETLSPASAETDGRNARRDASSVASASSTLSLAMLRSVLFSRPVRM